MVFDISVCELLICVKLISPACGCGDVTKFAATRQSIIVFYSFAHRPMSKLSTWLRTRAACVPNAARLCMPINCRHTDPLLATDSVCRRSTFDAVRRYNRNRVLGGVDDHQLMHRLQLLIKRQSGACVVNM